MNLQPLNPLEARVLGVLVEKALTVPDSYPLSLNSLTLGCNQKTARAPVMNAGENEVQAAVDRLKSLNLVLEASGSRVRRYEHNIRRVLGLPSQSIALLATMLLRGPQTASELRANCERLHRFIDLSSVEGFLEELAAWPEDKGGPLAVRLPRSPGSREARWMHLLSGDVRSDDSTGIAAAAAHALAPDELAALRKDHAALQQQVDRLSSAVDHLYRELGINRNK